MFVCVHGLFVCRVCAHEGVGGGALVYDLFKVCVEGMYVCRA